MPSKPDMQKVRVKWSGATVNPALYANVGGAAVRLDPDDTPPPPPPGSGLAIPKGAVNGYGSAADFYDSVGVNLHFRPPFPSGNPMTNPANVIDDLAELGVRHVRDTITASFIDSRSYEWRAAHLQLKNRNAAVPGGEQPIFVSVMVPGWTNYQPYVHRTGGGGPTTLEKTPWTVAEWFQGLDGGQQHRNPGWGALITNGTTSNPNATTPNPWNTNDPEYFWSLISSIEGANEPSPVNLAIVKTWMQQIKNAKNTHTTTVAFGGKAVATEDGLRSNVRANQIPVVGPSVINAGTANSIGDMTTGQVDCGDQHPYAPGYEPSFEHFNLNVAGGPTSGCYNGTKRNPPDPSKHLPWFITEFGQATAGDSLTGYRLGHHGGYWPAPDSICAEYIIRQFMLFWFMGVRRSYLYTSHDETNPIDVEEHFGLLTKARAKKQQFYALRNLLSLIGFSEAPPANQRKIAVSVPNFAPQGMLYSPTVNQIFAGNGYNRHYAMFNGPGANRGQIHWQTRDRLDLPQMQQTATKYIVVLLRQVALCDPEPMHWNVSSNTFQEFGNITGGSYTPPTQTLTVNFPAGVSQVRECTPTAGGATTPNDGKTWSAAKTLTAGDTATTVALAGKMKLLEVTV